ncbi:hypothetical protein Tco_1053129 [Tanacetum coccineum]
MMRLSEKNILIANDNLIADCLSNELFTEMHDAHTVVQARCLELEAKLSKLNDRIQKDDHNELVKRFSNLEINHLNLQLKYQHLKKNFGNNKSLPAQDALDFDLVFVSKKMKASIQGKDNAIKKLRMQISLLKKTRSDADHTLDFRALDFQITQLTEKVNVLQEQNELFRAENEKVKQHYKELYDSIKIMRAKHIEQTTALLTDNENLKAYITAIGEKVNAAESLLVVSTEVVTRGTTQVVTRGTTNDWYEVAGTRYCSYEVAGTSSVKTPLKADKAWKEKLFHPANHVRIDEPKKARENSDAPIIEDWVSDDEEDVESIPKEEKKTDVPTATEIESVKTVKPVRKPVRYVEMYRSQKPRGNQRNWNNQKSQQLGSDFVMNNKHAISVEVLIILQHDTCKTQ